MTGQATRHSADAWLVGVGAVVGTVAIVAVAPTAVNGDPTIEVVTQVLLALAVGFGILVLGLRLNPTATGFLLALLTGLFLCGGAAILLNANAFAPLGAVADQSYRTAYLTKFAHHWGLVDYSYQGLPSFYPPLFFWVLGRLSAVLGIAPWQMLKVGLLASAFLVPTAGWLLWRPIVGPRRAAAVVIVSALAYQDWYNAHLWLAIAVFVPWWLWYVLGAGRDRRLSRGELVGGVLIGAAVALTYWYVLLIGLVQLAVLLAVRRTARAHGRELEPRRLHDVGIVFGGIVVVTAIYWLPLAISVLTTSGAETMQNRYYTGDEVSLPAAFLSFDLRGFVLLAGLVWLAATALRRPLSMHLLGIAGAAYVVYLVGYLGFLVDYPIDTIRVRGVIEFTLAAGAALGAIDVTRAFVSRHVSDRIDPKAALVALAIGALVLVFALGQDSVRSIPYLEQQRKAAYPTLLLADFDHATDGRANGSVVLTDLTDLSSFRPIYVFNTSDAHYSHPAALFTDRADLLKELSHEADAEAFALAFTHNRYDRIDYVALHSSSGGLTYSYLDDAFPLGVSGVQLTFPEELFESDAFTRVGNKSVTVLRVNHDPDPLRSLQSCPREPSAAKCQVLGRVLAKYSTHLDGEARDLAEAWATARSAGN
jgi:galactan 5-O-arabinofuranosyltransferase